MSEISSRGDSAPLNLSGVSFESALQELETIVRQLESGDAPLDALISQFERGRALQAHCQARLDEAKARIEQIVQNPDGTAAGTRPFDAD